MAKDRDIRDCPFCGKQTSVAAVLCPACNKDISVFIPGISIEDQALRHKAIKTLMETDKASFDSYSRLNMAFRGETRSIAEGLSFQKGNSAKEALKQIGIEVEVKPIQMIKESNTQDGYFEKRAPRKLMDAVIWLAALVIASILFYRYVVPNLKERPAETASIDQEMKQEEPTSGDIEENISKLVAATVVIKGNKGSGSGFLITPDGYVVTNNHVLADQYNLSVRTEDGRTYVPEIVRKQSELDLALLKIDAQDLSVLKIGDATKMKTGYDVWTIGAPKELAFTVTKGILSFVGRNINGIKYLQSDVAINPGNSGGPMINSKGEVIGINTFILTDSEGLNFALPINYIYAGEDPLLAALPNAPVETKREDFMAGQGDRITAMFDEPKMTKRPRQPSSSKSSPIHQTMMKELNERYEIKKQDLDREKQDLESSRQELREKLYNTRDQIEITAENTLADRITELDIQILEKEIEILEARYDYDNRAIRILDQALNIGTGESEMDMIRQQLSMIKSEIPDLTEQMKYQRQKINDIKANKPGF